MNVWGMLEVLSKFTSQRCDVAFNREGDEEEGDES
jgi:hypothetical protein